MKWTDAEDIGIALAEKFPDVDPLTIRFTDLRERVLALDGFDDDPKTSNEPKLEAIQMAWYEEFKDAQMSAGRHVPARHAGVLHPARRRHRAGRRARSCPGSSSATSPLDGVPDVRGALGRRPRRARRRPRDAQPDHPQELAASAARSSAWSRSASCFCRGASCRARPASARSPSRRPSPSSRTRRSASAPTALVGSGIYLGLAASACIVGFRPDDRRQARRAAVRRREPGRRRLGWSLADSASTELEVHTLRSSRFLEAAPIVTRSPASAPSTRRTR